VTSVTVPSGQNSVSFYFVSTASSGTAVLAVSATGYLPTNQTETLVTSPYVWTGLGGNSNWSTNANWSGGTAPGSIGLTAVFDGTCGIHCNSTVNSSPSGTNVRITSAYTGTITVGSGVGASLGYWSSGGLNIAGGTF
jgi:hypothetical protein